MLGDAFWYRGRVEWLHVLQRHSEGGKGRPRPSKAYNVLWNLGRFSFKIYKLMLIDSFEDNNFVFECSSRHDSSLLDRYKLICKTA
jgi:hypothetical protein